MTPIGCHFRKDIMSTVTVQVKLTALEWEIVLKAFDRALEHTNEQIDNLKDEIADPNLNPNDPERIDEELALSHLYADLQSFEGMRRKLKG